MDDKESKLGHPVMAINWNRLQDIKDLEVWERLTGNFWLPERMPLDSDLSTWETLSEPKQQLMVRLLASLALLETLQSTHAVTSLIPYSLTQHEEAIYTNMAFMKSVHVKAYNAIISTLITGIEADEVFRWAEENTKLDYKIKSILSHYQCDSHLKAKIASTLLDGFLFHSGFYLPMYLSSRGKLINIADMFRLITRDNTVYSYYIGYKYQCGIENLHESSRQELKDYTYDLLFELYDNEVDYTQDLYDTVGLTEDVKKFLRYNANVSLKYLGYEPLFPHDETDVNPTILSAVSINGEENCNLFSQSRLSHVNSKAVSTEDDDWAF